MENQVDWIERQEEELSWFHPAYQAIWLRPAIRQKDGTALYSTQPALFPRPQKAIYPANTKDELLHRRKRQLLPKGHPDDPDEFCYPETVTFHGGRVTLENRLQRFRPKSLRNHILKPYNDHPDKYPETLSWGDGRRFRQHFLFKYFYKTMFLLFDFDAHNEEELDELPRRLVRFKEISQGWTTLFNRSPGSELNGKRVTGIHAWVILDRCHDARFVHQHMVLPLKRSFSDFKEIYCGVDKPIRVPGQKFLEPVSVSSDGTIVDLQLNGSASECYDALTQQLTDITSHGQLTSIKEIVNNINPGAFTKKKKSEAGRCANKYVTASSDRSRNQDTFALIAKESGRLVRHFEGDGSLEPQIVDLVKQHVIRHSCGATARDAEELHRKVSQVVQKHLRAYDPCRAASSPVLLSIDEAVLDQYLAEEGVSDEARLFVKRWLPVAQACKGFVATRPRNRCVGKTMWEIAGSQRRFNRVFNELIDHHILFIAKGEDGLRRKCRQTVLHPELVERMTAVAGSGITPSQATPRQHVPSECVPRVRA
jgi:hypothetical protein